jgi:hypothetical protein
MSHTYLLDLYKVLAERTEHIQATEPAASPATELYRQGRLDALADFSAFLRKGYHTKLPRRMQNI